MARSAKNAATATYRQIEDSLRGKLRQGKWPVGTMLPSRRELAKEYGVSPITVERAVTRLVADGLLRADDRRGTFVLRAEREATVPSDPLPPGLADVYSGGMDAPLSRKTAPPTTVGIIAPLYLADPDHLELNNYWMRQVVHSMEHVFSREEMTTRFFNRVRGGKGQPIAPLPEAMAAVRAEGADALAIIAWSADPREVDDALAGCDDVPVVCVTTGELRRPVPHVSYENASAGYQAAQHLLRQGVRSPILYLAPFTASWVKERLEGVRAALEHEGLPAESVYVYPHRCGPWDVEEDPQILGYEVAKAAFAEGIAPKAVIGASDGVAFGFLRAASEAGWVMGRDYLIVGFDDRPEARSLHLTSVRPPMEVIGQEAARLLLRRLYGEQVNMQVRMRGHLIVRESSRVRGRVTA